MRIALVTETYTPEINGVAKTLARLVDELKTRGHGIHLVRPRQKTDTAVKDNDLTLVRGLPIPGYPGMQFGLPATQRLKKAWAQQTPDIVYVATEGPLGRSAVQAANAAGIPVLSGFHTNFHNYSKHYRLGILHSIIFNYLKSFHNRTDCTLAPSPEMVKSLQQGGINNTALFSRGIDSNLFSPDYRNRELRDSWQVAEKDPVMLYVGRIAAEKNIHQIIESYTLSKQHQPDLRLVMVGEGPLRSKLQSRYRDIIFCGNQTGNDLSRHYASADIFLFPSETETFGNVILEAMASGLGVVAYDYAAAHMHIQNRHNGITVSPGDVQAFHTAALNLLQDANLNYRIRQQARQTALSVDWAHVIDNFENLVVTYAQSKQCNRQNAKTTTVSADGQA
ncbi:MAG: glycosyltransferase family 4 protein [Gammaproteobacteria bacterium]